MSSALDVYLGWSPFTHIEGCTKPVVEVDWRSDEQTVPRRGGPEHVCQNEDCEHRGHFDKLTVRMMCRTCGKVVILTGAQHSFQGTNTDIIGYGTTPKKVGSLWLYPGERMFNDSNEDVWDYLVADKKTPRLTQEDVVGSIGSGLTRRRAVIWSAAAHPDFRPSSIGRSTPQCVFRTRTDQDFKTPSAAAKWIEKALEQGPLSSTG